MKDLHILTYPKLSLDEIKSLHNEESDFIVLNYGGDDDIKNWVDLISNVREYHYCLKDGQEWSSKGRSVSAHRINFNNLEEAEAYVLKNVSGDFQGEYANFLIAGSNDHANEVVEEIVEEVVEEDELLHEHEDGEVHSHEGGDQPHEHEEDLDEEIEDNDISSGSDSGSGTNP